MMTKRNVLLTAIILLALPFAGCAEPETDPGTTPPGTTPSNGDPGNGDPGNGDAPHYVVGTDCAFPPFEDMVDGECVGYDMDVIHEIAARNGWMIEIRNVGFDVLIPQVQQGELDMVISAMTIRPDRAEVVDFSIPYFIAENQAVTKRVDDTREFSSLEDLAGLTVGVQSGTTAQFYVDDELGDDVTLRRYDTYPLAMQALRAGEADVVVMDAPAQERWVEDDEAVEIAFLFEVQEEYGIAVQQGSALLDVINEALSEMWDDGTIDQLREEWGV